MYEQVVFNTLSLVGLARPYPSALRYNGNYESVMLVNDRDIQVPLRECVDGTCDQCPEGGVSVCVCVDSTCDQCAEGGVSVCGVGGGGVLRF